MGVRLGCWQFNRRSGFARTPFFRNMGNACSSESEVIIEVPRMVRGNSANAVHLVLSRVKGVTKVNVSPVDQKARVKYAPPASVDDLVDAINGVGFDANPIDKTNAYPD